jgi:microcystin-dependent protein
MADEIVYRLLQGDGIQLLEDSAARTLTISVPGLAGKLNVGDIGQASQVAAGIIEIATDAEVAAGSDAGRAITPAGLASHAQISTSDSTANRLLRVGAFGIGGASVLLNGQNLNTDLPTGFYYCQNPVNGPDGVGDGWLKQEFINSQYIAQTFAPAGAPWANRRFLRNKAANAWQAWREVYHTGNFDPNSKANTSGTYLGITAGNSALVNGQSAAMLAPPGAICHFAGGTVPTGWLFANGGVVGRETYPALFAAIGTTYGAGNGSNTFNLPDLRGLFSRAWDGGRGVDNGRGFGSVQGSANLSHAHGASIGAAGGHSHGGLTTVGGNHAHSPLYVEGSNDDNGDAGSFVMTTPRFNNGQRAISSSTTAAGGDHQHSLQIDGVGDHAHSLSIGADGAGEARPINIALLACIKT